MIQNNFCMQVSMKIYEARIYHKTRLRCDQIFMRCCFVTLLFTQGARISKCMTYKYGVIWRRKIYTERNRTKSMGAKKTYWGTGAHCAISDQPKGKLNRWEKKVITENSIYIYISYDGGSSCWLFSKKFNKDHFEFRRGECEIRALEGYLALFDILRSGVCLRSTLFLELDRSPVFLSLLTFRHKIKASVRVIAYMNWIEHYYRNKKQEIWLYTLWQG